MDTLKFKIIELVMSQHCLWDMKHESYSKSDKGSTWDMLGKELDTPGIYIFGLSVNNSVMTGLMSPRRVPKSTVV